MITWPDEIIDDIAKRKSVLYLGSGVSANSTNDDGRRPATWEEFLKKIINKDICNDIKTTVETSIGKDDYLTACEIIVDHIGDHKFGEEAANEFRRPRYRPHEIHEVIFSLDCRIVITPNIDKIYEQYAGAESCGTIVAKTYYDPDVAKYLRSPDYLIIKAHGSVDRTDMIIFTHQQYANARYQFATFYKILDALMITHTFIFIGCGINDPDIQLTLENYNFNFPNCRPHYFITSQNNFPPQVMSSLKRNRNIEIITYDNSAGDHSDLLDSLKSLYVLVEDKRKDISETTKW